MHAIRELMDIPGQGKYGLKFMIRRISVIGLQMTFVLNWDRSSFRHLGFTDP